MNDEKQQETSAGPSVRGGRLPGGSPLFPLDKAVERARMLFKAVGLIRVHEDQAACFLGYSSPSGGTAKKMLATLASYGLIVRNGDRRLSVSESFADFEHDVLSRRTIARAWLTAPPVFGDILSRFIDRPPSREFVAKELIRSRKLLPAKAEELADVLFRSLDFLSGLPDRPVEPPGTGVLPVPATPHVPSVAAAPEGSESFMVKLSGGRRAVFFLPNPLHSEDLGKIHGMLSLLVDRVNEPPSASGGGT